MRPCVPTREHVYADIYTHIHIYIYIYIHICPSEISLHTPDYPHISLTTHIWFTFQDNGNTEIFETSQYSHYQKYWYLFHSIFTQYHSALASATLHILTLTVFSWLYWGPQISYHTYMNFLNIIHIYMELYCSNSKYSFHTSSILIRFIHSI